MRPAPRWRLRTARAATSLAAAVIIGGWALTAGAPYSLLSHITHMHPTTKVLTARPEVGVLVDAPSSQVPTLASALSALRIHASFTVSPSDVRTAPSLFGYGDQTVPELGHGGLVRWLQTRGQLHRVLEHIGWQRRFLYVSDGPSVGQWLLAHHAGGRLIAGAIHCSDGHDLKASLRPGEVVELRVGSTPGALALLQKLHRELRLQHLQGVPVGRLLRDAGQPI